MASRVRAPELTGRGGWIGVQRPLRLADLRGKVVLLHFWTSTCVNCLRAIAQVRPLEELFADELVVVGVHSPKFPAESDHEAVVKAVARHRLTHPVLDDPDLTTWHQYAVSAWPTFVLVDPAGYVVGTVSGEGCRPVLERAVAAVVQEHGSAGTLRRGDTGAGWTAVPSGPLAFPQKVAVSPDGRRLAVADTGHDQVLVCSPDGLLLAAHTGFRQPHGVRFDAEGVVVCDTGADRVIRSTGEVMADGIASPWDLAADADGSWVVAEAGRHRLVRLRPGERSARPLAGTGAEDLADGPAAKAMLAQPSGLARVDGAIAFVDAESSSLRLLTDDGHVVTLVGEGLFEWGASDGPGPVARMQHPLGVAAGPDGRIYVADTLNSRLRVWHEGTLRTVPAAGLAEPGGLDVLPDGRLVVADTNNHRVVVVDPDSGAVEALDIDESWLLAADGAPLRALAGGVVRLPFRVDVGEEPLDTAGGPPVRVDVQARPAGLLAGGPSGRDQPVPEGEVELQAGEPGAGLLLVEVAVRTCPGGRCHLRAHRRRHPFEVSAPSG